MPPRVPQRDPPKRERVSSGGQQRQCTLRPSPGASLYWLSEVYTCLVAKHLIDLDEQALGAARAELGTSTIRDTVNEALRRATSHRARRVAAALDSLADIELSDRADAWR